jgi:hypothetical protein
MLHLLSYVGVFAAGVAAARLLWRLAMAEDDLKNWKL